MLNLFLIISYLGCLSSNQMLSMLLLLVLSYITASVWFISNGAIYTGLLYILVYVGAIVVLIMFVVQLTNTSLTGDNPVNFNLNYFISTGILILSVFLLLIIGYLNLNYSLLINFTNLNVTNDLSLSNLNNSMLMNFNTINFYNSNLSTLANSIFNEYGFILILSVHAIILAIIGPIKLALSSTN